MNLLNQYKRTNLILGLCLLGYFILFIFVRHDPFFGDAKSTISRLAYQIYDSNFKIWLYPQGMDPGHPVTFPLLHTALWKVFGNKLVTSHTLNFVFVFISLLTLYKLDNYYKAEGWLLVLVAINPVFIAMAATLNTHMMLVAFLLLYHHSFIKNNTFLMILYAALLLLTHNQGMLLVAVLWIAQLITTRNLKKIIFQLPALIPWIIWLFIHKHHTGWFLFPPEYAEFRGIGSSKALFKNALIIVWRLADFGLFIIPICAFFFMRKERTKEFIYVLLFSLGAIGAIWLSVKFSIAHRYFIFAWIFLSIPAALYFRKLKTPLKIILLLVIISGSFWYYPGKQLADANIQYRHYFSIYKQIQNNDYLKSLTLYSTPPNESGPKITHISSDPKLLNIKSISETENTKEIDAVMYGNVCGPLPKPLDSAVLTWHFITVKSGPAWVNIYTKAPFEKQIPIDFPKREASWMEIKMKQLKNRYN